MGIISAAHGMGIELMIHETYRSQDRQQELFNQRATKLRTVGVHHYGLACDIVRVVAGEPSWKGGFSFLGQLAQSSGMNWGEIGEHRTLSTASSTACMCSVAPWPGKGTFSLAHGFRTKPTIPARTIKTFWPLLLSHRREQAQQRARRAPVLRGLSNVKSPRRDRCHLADF